MSYGDINLDQHWLEWWLVGWRHNFITWTNVNLPKVVCGFHLGNFARSTHDLNTLRPRQTYSHFADDILKLFFLNENVWILIEISMKFVPKGPINNISSLVQIMAWRRPGDKPLSEPMMVWSLTHICVTRPQWVNSLRSDEAFIRSDNDLSPGRCQAIIWISAGILLIRTLGTNFKEIVNKIHAFSFNKMHLEMSSAKWQQFCLGLSALVRNWTSENYVIIDLGNGLLPSHNLN